MKKREPAPDVPAGSFPWLSCPPNFLRTGPRYNESTWGWIAHVSSVAKDQLHGWKEIAAYLGRDERTAKRWEKQRGLPVRRIPGSGRANVYIVIAELEAWLSADFPAAAPVPVAEVRPAPLQPSSLEDQRPAEDGRMPLESPIAPPPPLDATVVSPGVLAGAGLSSGLRGVAVIFVLAGAGLAAVVARRLEAKKQIVVLPPARRLAAGSLRGEVDQQYLQSLYFFEQRTPESLQEARRNLLEVIAHHPEHAPAFAQLANTYLMLREFSSVPDEEAYTQAQQAASQAIALDPGLPEAHASLGYIAFFSARDPGFAEQHFREAIRLDPGCALAHFWYGSLLTHQGRYQEALDQLTRAQQLQPTSSAIQASRAYALGLSGQREEAVHLLRSLLKTDPNAPAPHRSLARLSLMQPRNVEQYLDETQKFAELRKDSKEQHQIALARQSFHRGGEQAMWRSILAGERVALTRSGGPSYLMAESEAQLGQTEPSLQHLQILCARHDSLVMNLMIDPLLEPLREDPTFRALVVQAGLRPQLVQSGAMPLS